LPAIHARNRAERERQAAGGGEEDCSKGNIIMATHPTRIRRKVASARQIPLDTHPQVNLYVNSSIFFSSFSNAHCLPEQASRRLFQQAPSLPTFSFLSVFFFGIGDWLTQPKVFFAGVHELLLRPSSCRTSFWVMINGYVMYVTSH